MDRVGEPRESVARYAQSGGSPGREKRGILLYFVSRERKVRCPQALNPSFDTEKRGERSLERTANKGFRGM